MVTTFMEVVGQSINCTDGQEEYTLILFDNWGDGWYAGNNINHQLVINNEIYGNEFSNGNFTDTGLTQYSYNICLSPCINISFNDVGSYEYECSYQLINSNGNVVYSGNHNSNSQSFGQNCGCTDPLAINYNSSAQNDDGTCVYANPFCTDTSITFPASINIPNSLPNNYNCLNTSPNPAFYYMEIAQSGNLVIDMYSQPEEDIDFLIWGPYNDYTSIILEENSVIDCSYSPFSTETANINNAQVGEIYVFLITNYSNNECDIIFEQTSGNGSTDCGIVECEINAGEDASVNLCQNDQIVNLFNFIGGTPDTGGSWIPSILTNGYLGSFDPSSDFSDTFLYIVDDGLCSDTASVDVQVFQNQTPQAISIETCETLNLYPQLSINNTNGSWSGPSELGGFPTFLGQYVYGNDQLGTYYYNTIDNNGCDISYPITVTETNTLNDTVFYETCLNNSLYFQLSINDQSGSWSGPSNLAGQPYQGVFLYGTHNFGTYNYNIVDDDGCTESYPLTVTELTLNAGNDTSLTFCNDDESINLFDYLGPDAEIDGVWNSEELTNGYLGTFDPNSNLSANYTYTVYNLGCSDQSEVNISVISVSPSEIQQN
ncbi:MAG: hypothetical protein ACON4E_02870 [Flavobacteriales bacterium]